jgi:hypothetical protein
VDGCHTVQTVAVYFSNGMGDCSESETVLGSVVPLPETT